MNTCNLVWNCTWYKTRIEIESNQIGDSGKDKIFFYHVGNDTNELEDKWINSNYSLGIFTPCSPKTVNTEAAAQLSSKGTRAVPRCCQNAGSVLTCLLLLAWKQGRAYRMTAQSDITKYLSTWCTIQSLHTSTDQHKTGHF